MKPSVNVLTAPGRLRQWLRRLVVCLMAALFLWAGEIAYWTAAKSRYFSGWERRDALAIVSGVLLLGLLLCAAAWIVEASRREWLVRTGRWLFLILLALGVSSLGVSCSSTALHECRYEYLFGLTLVIWPWLLAGLYRYQTTLLRWAVRFCLIVSPLFPLLVWQLFSWPAWPFQPGPAVAGPNARSGAASGTPAAFPIFLFIFDEWSYQRTTEHEEFLECLPNLRALGRQSLVFSQARSPGNMTVVSIPRLIFQSEGRIQVEDEGAVWDRPGEVPRPTAEIPSLFRTAQAHGYRTALVGFHLPYGRLLGDQLDECHAHAMSRLTESFAGRTLEYGFRSLRFLPDPSSQLAWRKAYAAAFGRQWFLLHQTIRDETLQVIRSAPDRTFALFHWPLPHAPFVFNADGSYRGRPNDAYMQGTPADYRRHLELLDRRLGEILATLRATGQFDRAMLIVTSDHSWREEPDPDLRAASDGSRRVPLLIKLPRQTAHRNCSDCFCTTQLGPLIESVLRGETDPQRAVQLVHALSQPSDLARQPASTEAPAEPVLR